MNLLSAVRLGVAAGFVKGIDFALLNDLLLSSQRAHLQRLMERRMTSEDRDIARAQLFRERLWPAIQVMDAVEKDTPAESDSPADEE
jgi:protein arginine kinase